MAWNLQTDLLGVCADQDIRPVVFSAAQGKPFADDMLTHEYFKFQKVWVQEQMKKAAGAVWMSALVTIATVSKKLAQTWTKLLGQDTEHLKNLGNAALTETFQPQFYQLAQHTTPIANTHGTAMFFASEPTENLKMLINVRHRNITNHDQNITAASPPVTETPKHHQKANKTTPRHHQKKQRQDRDITETSPKPHRDITETRQRQDQDKTETRPRHDRDITETSPRQDRDKTETRKHHPPRHH